ncbi:kinase-like protein [Suillus weaverae]|nr:kinase-like protein [Suillus weaverae]
MKGHTKNISSISYFPDGKQMISGSYDKTTHRWDLEAGKEIEEARDVCKQEVHAVGVSRDGRWVVTGGGDFTTDHGELEASDVESGMVRTFKGHSAKITCIDISVDSTLLASGSDDFTARIWSLDTGELVAGPFQSADFIGAVGFSQNSKKLAIRSCVGMCFEVWDVQAQQMVVRAGDRCTSGWSWTHAPVFWTTEDKSIVAAFSFTDDAPIEAKTIYEFDSSTLKTIGAPFEGHTHVITCLALSPDCALLASTSNGDTIKLWAFESRQLLASFHVSFAYHIILSPDSHQLAYTAEGDIKIYICDIPPDILASIQPAQQLPRVHSQPRNVCKPFRSLIYPAPVIKILQPDAMPCPAAVPRNSTMGVIRAQTPGEPPYQTARSTSRGGEWIDSQRRDFYPSFVFSNTDTVLPVRNEFGYSPPEVILQNLTEYVTKDEDYPSARGGFGEIWKCTCRIDRSPIKVAVKALQVYTADQLGEAKTKDIQRIKREFRICAKLKHANILPVYGYIYGFGPFIAIVSPWAENGNLTAFLEREGAALTLVRRFQLLRDIIAGLQYLHANSVIHGDFNGVRRTLLRVFNSLRREHQPNVLIYGDGTACVADFGLSLMYSEVISASQASWTSTLEGNMRWMAPELLVDQEDGSQVRPSEQSDIYSFGGIMLQVLTNKVPYYHLSNDAAIILCIAKSQTPSRSRYPALPEKYWELIEQCWSTDPRDRPSTEGAEGAIRNEFYSLSRPH